MDYSDIARFYALRGRLFDLIRKVDEGHHKSYEGALELTFGFPCTYESHGNPERPEFALITLFCYLLCENRRAAFKGDTFSEALDKFDAWLTDLEQNMTDYMERGII